MRQYLKESIVTKSIRDHETTGIKTEPKSWNPRWWITLIVCYQTKLYNKRERDSLISLLEFGDKGDQDFLPILSNHWNQTNLPWRKNHQYHPSWLAAHLLDSPPCSSRYFHLQHFSWSQLPPLDSGLQKSWLWLLLLPNIYEALESLPFFLIL